MKQIEPLPGSKGERQAPAPGVYPYWGTISRELNEKLRLTKAEFRILFYIVGRAGKDSACICGVKRIAYETRTHPVYVRWIVRHLLQRKLIKRICRPGSTNELRPAGKAEWLLRFGQYDEHGEWSYKDDGAQPEFTYEETASESHIKILWDRAFAAIPNAPKALFDKRMKDEPELFERVLAEVEDRAKRGRMAGADRLPKLEDPLAYFNYTWSNWMTANGRKSQ